MTILDMPNLYYSYMCHQANIILHVTNANIASNEYFYAVAQVASQSVDLSEHTRTSGLGLERLAKLLATTRANLQVNQGQTSCTYNWRGPRDDIFRDDTVAFHK